jgi:hypothetical protein
MIMTEAAPNFPHRFIFGDSIDAYLQVAHLFRDNKLLKI